MYPSVMRVSVPSTGACLWVPSQVRSERNVVHVEAMVHGFLSGSPMVELFLETRPYIQPSHAYWAKPHLDMVFLTLRRRQ